MDAIFDQGSPEPCPTPFNMAQYVLSGADRHPDRLALSVVGYATDENWTYQQLKSAVLGVAAGLMDAGLKPGARVLMRLGNEIDFPIAFLGAIAAGLIPVPTSNQLTEPEITTITASLKPDLIVASPGIAMPDRVSCPVVGVDELQKMRGFPCATWKMGDANRPAYIIYTSGTGGTPRGVVHSHRAVWARRMMWDGWYGLGEQDRLMHAGAFNWTYTLGTGLMDPWARGATALIPAPGVKPAQIPGLLAKNDVTIFAAAPGVFRQMLKASFPTMPKLRHALSAGEKMPDRIRDGWKSATGCAVYEAYGMSECSTFISQSPRAGEITGTGIPQPGRRVAILAEKGIAKTGETGMIGVDKNDPGLMLGYLDDPDATAARFRGEWFITGDNGLMHRDGSVEILGRDDDMMNAGGFRVSPLDVENAMRGHPLITDCAAVEQSVKADVAVIALYYQSEHPIADQELAKHATNVLARYKQPRIYLRIQNLPRGANGKLLRRKLRRSTPGLAFGSNQG